MILRNQLQRLWNTIRPTPDTLREATAPVLLAVGLIYMMILIFRGDWGVLLLVVPGWVLLFGLQNHAPLRERLLGEPFNLRHALHIMIYWALSGLWALLLAQMIATPAIDKDSELFYIALLAFWGVTWAAVRSLLIIVHPRSYEIFSTSIPLWEQILLFLNELVALGLVAYVWGSNLVRLFQPSVFTVRVNPLYVIGLLVVSTMFYGAIQAMWLERGNRWLSQRGVWLVSMRVMSPFILFVTTLLIATRFTEQTDPRTASLLNNADVDFAVLSLMPVLWLLVLLLMVLVYTSGSGLRQRFLPDALLEHIGLRLRRVLQATSDIDVLLLLGVLGTFTPVYLLFLGDSTGFIGQAREAITNRGNALIETSEQALALLFVLPFYVFTILLLILYAVVISRPILSAEERDKLMDKLPVGFMIALIITLYLFAVPFTQAFSEGRLPTLSRDLGRILAFYVLIPLLVLYVHYIPFVRLPYGRGQRLWRERHAVKLEQDLRSIDRRITQLNQELSRMDSRWQITRGEDVDVLKGRVETLHRYVHLNGERDNLNMQRLQIVQARQNLAEISDTPLSVAVARLPLRIISLGIPLLLFFQLYQWAVLNQGLRDVVNNPNITVVDFIRILIDNIEF